MVRSRLEEGSLDRTNILEFATDVWRTACQVAELNVARGRRIDTHMNFWNPMGGFYKAFTGARSTEERREHVERRSRTSPMSSQNWRPTW